MSEERASKKSKVIKERLEEKKFELAHGRSINLHLSYQLVDKGPLMSPGLHLFASAKNAYTTPPGLADAPPLLTEQDLGAYQLQLLIQVTNRVRFLTAPELAQFEKGGYIGVGCEVPRRSVLSH